MLNRLQNLGGIITLEWTQSILLVDNAGHDYNSTKLYTRSHYQIFVNALYFWKLSKSNYNDKMLFIRGKKTNDILPHNLFFVFLVLFNVFPLLLMWSHNNADKISDKEVCLCNVLFVSCPLDGNLNVDNVFSR